MSPTETAVRSTSSTASSTENLSLRVQRLVPTAIVPDYQTDLAAGMDLHACILASGGAAGGGTLTLDPITAGGRVLLVPTGLAIAIPAGFEGQVRPRSGLAAKFGVTVANAPGTIDADYRGELKVALINLGHAPMIIEHGMRIAQLVIAPVARATIVEVKSLDETRRGAGGFGSTGV